MNLPVHKRGTMDVIGTAIVDDDYAGLVHYKWVFDKAGYVMRKAGGRCTYLHHVVLGTRPAGLVSDHIDRDKMNNQTSNLRWATHTESMLNRNPYGASRFAGVAIDKINHKWKACYRLLGKTRNVGYFHSEVDAAQAFIFDKFVQGVGGTTNL